MSRWRYGNWAMGAVIIDKDDNIYPIGELKNKYNLKLEGFYEERYLFNSPYYKFEELTGQPYSRYEGSINAYAHIKLTDKSGKSKVFEVGCNGYTTTFEDCFMLLIITPGNDVDSTTIEFQNVDEVEFKEAIGIDKYNEWYSRYHGKSALTEIPAPLF